MSLPSAVVDRLFARLGATYGATWDRALGAAPLSDVKTVWAHELSGFAARLQDVAWALENLPERCPNVIEFRKLCRQAPCEAQQQLPAPQANPERLRAELAKLGEARKAAAQPQGARDWARRILARAAAGERVNRLSHRFAREAMGLPVGGGHG